MRCLIVVLFLFGCTNAGSFTQFDADAMLQSVNSSFSLVIPYGLNGYNPYLSAEQVVRFYCAKPSDKIFRQVYFNDPGIASKFDLTKKTAFVVHGWTDNGLSIWMQQFTQALVDNHDVNVCRVDWSIYSTVEYNIAVRNCYLVGKHLATFLTTLHNSYGVLYANIIMIGHSLGGQICGITGYNLSGAIGRIIAMDPANPLFTFPMSVPLKDQLDKDDAQFVTVVHSNNYMCGVGYSVGDADYYPNGGLSIQPGCIYPELSGIYATEFDPVSCSHFKACRFVQLSMYHDLLCLAVKCNSYQDYRNRNCTGITDTWGIESALIPGDFYFWGGVETKCLNQYWPSPEEETIYF